MLIVHLLRLPAHLNPVDGCPPTAGTATRVGNPVWLGQHRPVAIAIVGRQSAGTAVDWESGGVVESRKIEVLDLG